jgi:hypothetical protein
MAKSLIQNFNGGQQTPESKLLNSAFTQTAIKGLDKLILLTVCHEVDAMDTYQLTSREVADKAGISDREVKRTTKLLRELGVITYLEKSEGRTASLCFIDRERLERLTEEQVFTLKKAQQNQQDTTVPDSHRKNGLEESVSYTKQRVANLENGSTVTDSPCSPSCANFTTEHAHEASVTCSKQNYLQVPKKEKKEKNIKALSGMAKSDLPVKFGIPVRPPKELRFYPAEAQAIANLSSGQKSEFMAYREELYSEGLPAGLDKPVGQAVTAEPSPEAAQIATLFWELLGSRPSERERIPIWSRQLTQYLATGETNPEQLEEILRFAFADNFWAECLIGAKDGLTTFRKNRVTIMRRFEGAQRAKEILAKKQAAKEQNQPEYRKQQYLEQITPGDDLMSGDDEETDE